MNTTSLHPRLVVADPDSAVEFYREALDAELIERFTDNQNRVVHAAVRIANSIISLTQSVPEWGLQDPTALNGSACLLHLTVEDPDATAARMVALGGKVLIEIADRPYGKREGRVADSSGHLWILSKTIEELTADELSQRLK